MFYVDRTSIKLLLRDVSLRYNNGVFCEVGIKVTYSNRLCYDISI